MRPVDPLWWMVSADAAPQSSALPASPHAARACYAQHRPSPRVPWFTSANCRLLSNVRTASPGARCSSHGRARMQSANHTLLPWLKAALFARAWTNSHATSRPVRGPPSLHLTLPTLASTACARSPGILTITSTPMPTRSEGVFVAYPDLAWSAGTAVSPRCPLVNPRPSSSPCMLPCPLLTLVCARPQERLSRAASSAPWSPSSGSSTRPAQTRCADRQ